jgi:hypothetical protein
MADNELTGNDKKVATRKVSYSGETDQNVQAVGLVAFSGSDDAKVVHDLPGDETYGLDVDVTRFKHTSSPAQTATWSSATPLDTALALALSSYASVQLALALSAGTVLGGQVGFEGSIDGGVTWFPLAGFDPSGYNDYVPSLPRVPQSRLNLPDLATGTRGQLLAFNVGGLTDFRVRVADPPSGTATLGVRLIASTAPAPGVLIPLPTDGADVLSVTLANPLPAGSSVIGQVDIRNSPGLTDTQLRATPVPVSASALPLPAGAGTEATLAAIKAKTDNLDVALSTRTKPADTQPTSNAAASQADGHSANVGTLADADTASTLTGLLKKLKALLSGGLPAALAAGGGLKVEGVAGGVAQPVSAVSLPLPTGASTETTLGTRLSESDFDTKAGSLTEAAPASDTASSGLNGRLQRIAQRLTSLIALLPTALGANGGLKIEGVASGTVVPVSDGAGSLTVDAPVGTPVAARLSDGAAFLTTAAGRLAVDASGVAVPITDNAGSLTIDAAALPLPAGAATEATLALLRAIAVALGADISAVSVGVPLMGKVNDTVESHQPNTVQPLSVNQEGRLRVATAEESYNFTAWGDPNLCESYQNQEAQVSWA